MAITSHKPVPSTDLVKTSYKSTSGQEQFPVSKWGFEHARKRKLKDTQRTGSDLKQRKCMNTKRVLKGFSDSCRRSTPQPTRAVSNARKYRGQSVGRSLQQRSQADCAEAVDRNQRDIPGCSPRTIARSRAENSAGATGHQQCKPMGTLFVTIPLHGSIFYCSSEQIAEPILFTETSIDTLHVRLLGESYFRCNSFVNQRCECGP
jgi:hypothetical protein